MSGSDRRLYLSANVLSQHVLDFTAQDNLECDLELVVDIQTSTGYIRASDRNKYVGNVFYEARCVFPTISRKISHWLQNQIEFSSLSLELSNVDGKFNSLELGGGDYSGFIGKSLVVRVGLRDASATYTQIFSGEVTYVGGFGRTPKSLLFTTRDRFDKTDQNMPLTALSIASFPHIESDKINLAVPVIYGDYTTAMQKDPFGVETASVPVFCVNGIAALADPVGTNAQFIISENANVAFDTAHVYINRGGYFTAFASVDIVNVNGSNNYFEIIQNGATTIPPPPGVDGSGSGVGGSSQWIYANGDEIYVRVVGKPLPGGLNSNAVAQAQDILTTYGGFSSGDFDGTWASYAAKSSPAQSAIANIPCRLWLQEAQAAMQFAISLIAQVRLEIFVNRDEKLQLVSNHFEDWDPSSGFVIRNWDVVKDTFKPKLDSQNNFNRVRGLYDRQPSKSETAYTTRFYRNDAAIAQEGRTITKDVTFPNLYVASDVENQLVEILRLASAQSELIEMTLTSRSVLLDLGQWVRVDVKIGSTVFDNVPCQVREISYDPAGLKIPVVLWSMQAVRFPGNVTGYPGIVGGFDATMTAE